MTGSLYTVVCQFRGGIYVSQFRAADEIETVRAWAEMLKRDRPIARVSYAIARNALADLDLYRDMPPTALEGLSDVWFHCVSCGKDGAFLNIVRTAEG